MTPELLDIRRIYVEPAAAELPRGTAVLARFPDAQLVEVQSHQRIPELYGDETNVRRWVRIKREALVLGVKKTLTARPNGRSADFIAPSTANGCAMACAYCYVPRHKGYSNPITVFANIDRITGYLARHAGQQGTKPAPNECDPHAWVYDIGENSDCSVDARISDNVRDLVELFRGLPNAKASFATKHVNTDLLGWDPRGRTRIRFSLMPARDAKILDIRTSPIEQRIAAIDDFVAAGYEVHVNLSPVVVRDGWLDDWAALLEALDAGIGPAARAQLAAEVIFLTHNRDLHEVNLGWHPKAEELLWRPQLQQPKRSQNGSWNVRYRTGAKGGYVAALLDLIAARTPYLHVRYAF
ncbi:spore photoproduct lyase family protein [Actinoplanes teichomyceticus]|uniref:Spore photoproduct lyase family protein n=1 Tax=Actinoplanes teichomyceticus TaxID=1867 RepID=A0A561VKV0_ACTTI|nr:spore photoproduct lyase family protein [Actinoplanes teichomyceticus]TWG12248.1 spore photoproduct lyase family protein [Actinoplanes teichomyceticus]GIF14185.1 spore photoproduct lyase family protein [Actinoplanes teichomyceticus]